MKQKRLKSLLACLLVLCMVFGGHSAIFAQENDVLPEQTIVSEDKTTATSTNDIADDENKDDSTEVIEHTDRKDTTKLNDEKIEEEKASVQLKQNLMSANVETEANLNDAIASANGTKENPTTITIGADIELSVPLIIHEGKHIKLISSDNFKIIPSSNYNANNSVDFITLKNDSSVIVEDIVLDANYQGRVLNVGENASFTMEKGAWITRGGLPEGNPTKLSGAGIYSWSANASIIINGGIISDSRTNGTGTGGGICLGVATNQLIMTGGLITENTHSGIYVAQGVSGVINGGEITKNEMGVFLNSSALSLGGSILISENGTEDIAKDLFINQGSGDKTLTISSALQNDLLFYGIDGYLASKSATVIAKGTADYTITENDFNHVKYNDGYGYVYKTVFDSNNNQILNGQHYFIRYYSGNHYDGYLNEGGNYKAAYKYYSVDEHATISGDMFERDESAIAYYGSTSTGGTIYNINDSISPITDTSGLSIFTFWKKADPIKIGYRFEGWYEKDGSSNDDWGNKVENPIIKDGTNYYAKWKEKTTSTISFNNSLELNKTYDAQVVSISKSDYTKTEGAGEVTYTYQVKDGNDWNDIGSAPANAGTYRVKANVAENDTHKMAQTGWKVFTIRKADPTYKTPMNVTAIVGQTLANVTLPDGFTWQSPDTTSVGNIGNHTFKVTYTPNDTTNYNTVDNIEVTVSVHPKVEILNAIPTITADDKTLSVGETFDAKAGVTATDAEDGDITKYIEVISNKVDTSKAGIYEVTYKVSDSQGASVTKTISVTVKAEDVQIPTTDDNKKPIDTNTNDKPEATDKIPSSSNPNTSDATSMSLWITLVAISGTLLAFTAGMKRKRKHGN